MKYKFFDFLLSYINFKKEVMYLAPQIIILFLFS